MAQPPGLVEPEANELLNGPLTSLAGRSALVCTGIRVSTTCKTERYKHVTLQLLWKNAACNNPAVFGCGRRCNLVSE